MIKKRYMTEEEIQEGIASGKWHWVGGVGGCGNEYLASGRDPGPRILIAFIPVAAILVIGLLS